MQPNQTQPDFWANPACLGWSLRVEKQVGLGLEDLRKDSNSGSTVNLNEPVELIPEGPKFVLNWIGFVLMVENVSQFESGLFGSFGCTLGVSPSLVSRYIL